MFLLEAVLCHTSVISNHTTVFERAMYPEYCDICSICEVLTSFYFTGDNHVENLKVLLFLHFI